LGDEEIDKGEIGIKPLRSGDEPHVQQLLTIDAAIKYLKQQI
jgi:hypothetical protein